MMTKEKEDKYFKVFSLVDANGRKAVLEAHITHDRRFSISGEMGGASGQIDGHITPRTENQKKLLEIWRTWHLNDMQAGCEHQRAEQWEKKEVTINGATKRATQIRPDEHPDGLLTKKCDKCGYAYGTAWLKEDLPLHFEEVIDHLIKQIEQEEEDRTESYELTDEDKEKLEDIRVQALMKALELKEEDIQDIQTDEETGQTGILEYAGTEYYVMEEDEIEKECWEYLEQDSGYLWKQAVEADNTTKSLDDWIQEVIDMDGYGHLLNSWDGSQLEANIDGTWYFVIRRG